MLIDKPYYDYDYEYVPPKPKRIDVKKAREKFRGFFGHTKFHNPLDGAKAGTSETEAKVESETDIAERLQNEAQTQIKTQQTT